MKKRILLIDDDAFTRESLAVALHTEYEVFAAGTRSEAIEAYAEERVNLLVLSIDCSAERFRPEELNWLARIDRRMPIVMLTKESTLGVKPQTAVGDVLMERPLDLPVLLEKIGELISESEGENEARVRARQRLVLPFARERDREFCDLLQSRRITPYLCDVSNVVPAVPTPPGAEH